MTESPPTTRSRAAPTPRVPRIVRRVVPRGDGTRASDAPGGRAARLLTAVAAAATLSAALAAPAIPAAAATLATAPAQAASLTPGPSPTHAAPGGSGDPSREDPLPLGPRGLSEDRSTQQVAPGVRYTRIVRGRPSPSDVYTVDVGFRADRSAAEALAAELRADGHDPSVLRISERAADDPQRGPLGWLVRVGSFQTEAEAIALRDRLTAEGYAGTRVVFTGEDGGRTTGPWVVHVLEIDGRYAHAALDAGGARRTIAAERRSPLLDAALANGIVPERELLSSLAARTGAAASLNGGYFVIGPADGTPGDLAGISMLDGELVSESVGDRTSLVLSERGAKVESIQTRLRARASDGATREIDGLNRKPGLIRGCGGTGGDLPTEEPKHDFTCTDASELILFTEHFGGTTEPGEGAEAALDRRGRVIELRDTRGCAIPPGGSVLAGTGDAADWLRAHTRPGTRVVTRSSLDAGAGHRTSTAAGIVSSGRRAHGAAPTDIVNGGPRLLRAGRPSINAFAEGFHWPENSEFFYRFGVRRNPRTLAGVTAAGRILLVAIDGRRPGFSVGASFDESAAVMEALGARDALNLDGGGSTGMTIGPDLVTRPSDPTGERPIADAILIGG
jgi:Phosphodiester glycosidase/SPOR domain